jgi:hypothetical protein
MGLCPAKQFGFFGQRSSPQRGLASLASPNQSEALGFFGQRSRPNQSGGLRPALRNADGFAKSNQIKSMHPLLLRAAEKRRCGEGHQWPFFIYKFNNDFVSRYFD